ncbi:hypothetical protein AB0L34_03720 [Micromonospora sp. NPDC052213]|uniref:hypothetical protein n=1 Tax=Micromonospora sp. NPDC052213 TaxID=3155812 RepID=UPI00343A7827
MPTDLARPARQSAGCADDLTSNLPALVHRHPWAIIDAELHRLAGRAPSLSPADLALINGVLEDLAASAVLVPREAQTRGKAPLLTRILRRGAAMDIDEFGTEIDGSRRTVGKTPVARSSATLDHLRRR